jgi:hypothetical protein
MAQEKLVHNPFLCVVEDSVVATDVLGGVVRNGVSLGSWIRLHNSGRVGHLLMGCPSLLHNAHRGLSSGREWGDGPVLPYSSPSGSGVASSWR